MSILVLTSDTLIGTPATGNLEYNGQFFGTDSNASRAQIQRITQGTAVASTSGTSIDFTGIPSWVKRITVMFNGVSTNGTSNLLIRFGAGSVDTSGYASVNGSILGTNSTNISTDTSGHLITPSVSAATNHSGTAILSLIGSNTWIVNGTSQRSDGIANTVITTKTALSGALDRVRITTVNGTDTFDAGSINILYEG
jgi:hypothetical protein